MYLGFNPDNDRYGILETDIWIDTGLHCGEHIQALIDDKWIDTRIELSNKYSHSHGWYLIGFENVSLERLTVRYGDERDNKIIN